MKLALSWLYIKNTSSIVLLLSILNSHVLKTNTYAQSQKVGYTNLNTKENSYEPNMEIRLQSEFEMNEKMLRDNFKHRDSIEMESQRSQSRQKRLVWVTDDGRLALPPGTTLTFTPTIALPLVRHPPEGFFSNMSISFPVTIDFDKLGLTDNQNPLGDLPPLFARSFGRSTGKILANYIEHYIHHKTKRDLKSDLKQSSNSFAKKREYSNGIYSNETPQLPDYLKHFFHGGERVILYGAMENFLSNFGLDGKKCLLRFICEIHSRRLEHFGILGEITKLILTANKSPFSDLIPEYVRAQEIGEGRQEPGECFPYHKECPKSIFKSMHNQNYRDYQKSDYLSSARDGIYDNEFTSPNSPVNIENNRRSLKNKHLLSM